MNKQFYTISHNVGTKNINFKSIVLAFNGSILVAKSNPIKKFRNAKIISLGNKIFICKKSDIYIMEYTGKEALFSAYIDNENQIVLRFTDVQVSKSPSNSVKTRDIVIFKNEVISNETFNNKVIITSNVSFQNCKFQNCELIGASCGEFHLNNCKSKNTTATMNKNTTLSCHIVQDHEGELRLIGASNVSVANSPEVRR